VLPVAWIGIPLRAEKPLDGIISGLTEKYGGNVHEKGIVIITSKSVREDPSDKFAPMNAADLSTSTYFDSDHEAGQWICWDFRDMWIRPTHYTIRTYCLKSWVVEGSLDGENWTEIDRQTNNQDFKDGWNRASFPILRPTECRFIRLTQTGKRYCGDDYLGLCAVEFFGTLFV
jgi:hypothetical protein